MAQDDIESLVERARSGDMVALGGLYDAFAPRVYRFFRFRVATAETAEDLMQKVFLKMVEQLPGYRSTGAPFGAWLFRVARNTWIDNGRTTHPTIPIENLSGQVTSEGDPERSAEAVFQGERLRRAIADLPDAQREVIACRFFAELTPSETSALLGRSEVSVRVLQHRALAGLKRRMGNEEGVMSFEAQGSAQ